MDGRVNGASAGISTYDGNATAADILYGKKAVVDNVLVTGTNIRPVMDVGSTVWGVTATEMTKLPGVTVTIVTAGTYTFYWDVVAITYACTTGLYQNDSFVPASEQAASVGELTAHSYSMSCAAGDVICVGGKSDSGGTLKGAKLIAIAS